MAYNNYGFNGYGGNPYYQPQQFRQPIMPQQPYMQPQMQPMQAINPSELPISIVRSLTVEEANNYILEPNTKGLFIDDGKKTAVIKWCNNVGNSDKKMYKFEEIKEGENAALKTEEFLTKKDVGEFATKGEIDAVLKQISILEKKLEIKKIESEGK